MTELAEHPMIGYGLSSLFSFLRKMFAEKIQVFFLLHDIDSRSQTEAPIPAGCKRSTTSKEPKKGHAL